MTLPPLCPPKGYTMHFPRQIPPLALALMLASCAHAADPGTAALATACPERLTENGKFKVLQGMKLLDGPGNSATEALPAAEGKSSSWDIAAMRAAGADPQIVCAFRHTGKTLARPVPKEAGQCTFTGGYPAQSSCR